MTLQKRLLNLTENILFRKFIIALLIVNAVILGIETSKSISDATRHIVVVIDHTLLFVFIIEIVMRISGNGLKFFKDPWSVFDFAVTSISVLPFAGAFVAIRTLRIIRVLRLFSAIPKLRKVVNAIIIAIPGIFSIVIVMMVIFYVFSIIAVSAFSNNFPNFFGNIGLSMFTLFQVMTLESWASQIARPVIEVYPYSWIFFISFILVTTFTVLNLFIAIIITSMQNEGKKRRSTDPENFNSSSFREVEE